MKSDEYWRKREEAARKDRITDEKEMQKQIDAINQRMIDECNLQIDAWLQRYADKDGISLAEAKKRVSKLDIEEYERYAKKLVARGAVMRQEGKKVSYGSFTDEENEQMRLYNLTMKVNRLEMLKSRLGLETTAGYAELRNYLGSKLTDAAMAEAERQAGILGESVSMNAKEAGSIVNASFKGATFSQRLWNNQQELKAALDRSLTSALIQGQSSAKAAQQIREHFSGDFKKAGKAAMRLAVTELARVEIEAQKQSFEKMDFKQYTFLAVGPHPCDICQALDGKHFDVDKMIPGENAPPMHPYCHCSVAVYSDRSDYDEWLNSGAAMRGMLFENFKSKSIPERRLKDHEYIFGTFNYMNSKAIIKPRNIMKNMNKSKVGREALNYLLENNVSVRLEYGTDEDDGSRYGYYDPVSDEIVIFADITKTIEKTAEIIIHEATHRKSALELSQRSEVICMLQEKRHEKRDEELTLEDIKSTIKKVKELYPELPWR